MEVHKKPTSTYDDWVKMAQEYVEKRKHSMLKNEGYYESSRIIYSNWESYALFHAYLDGIKSVKNGVILGEDHINDFRDAAVSYVHYYESKYVKDGLIADRIPYSNWMHDAIWASYLSGIEDVLKIRVIH